MRIVLGNTVDGLLQDINEFVLRWIMGIQTVNLCIGILGSGSCRRTDPSVCADNQGMIAERNALRRAPRLVTTCVVLLYFASWFPFIK